MNDSLLVPAVVLLGCIALVGTVFFGVVWATVLGIPKLLDAWKWRQRCRTQAAADREVRRQYLIEQVRHGELKYEYLRGTWEYNCLIWGFDAAQLKKAALAVVASMLLFAVVGCGYDSPKPATSDVIVLQFASYEEFKESSLYKAATSGMESGEDRDPWEHFVFAGRGHERIWGIMYNYSHSSMIFLPAATTQEVIVKEALAIAERCHLWYVVVFAE